MSKSNKEPNTLFIFTTHYELNNYKMGDNKNLEEDLSFTINKTKYHCYEYNKSTKTLYIPRGFNYKLLRDHEPDRLYKLIPEIPEKLDKSKIFNIKSGVYRQRSFVDNQCINFLLSEGEYSIYSRSTQHMLNIPLTTDDRIYNIIETLVSLQYKALIIAHDKYLGHKHLYNWGKIITDYTTLKQDDIYIAYDYNGLVNMVENDIDDKTIYIIDSMAIRYFIEKYCNKNILMFRDIIDNYKFGVKIMDEVEKYIPLALKIDNALNILHNYYITPTNVNTADIQDLIMYKISYQDVNKLKVPNPSNSDNNIQYTASLYKTNPSKDDKKTVVRENYNCGKSAIDYDTDINSYISYVMRYDYIINQIYNIIKSKIYSMENAVLIVVNDIYKQEMMKLLKNEFKKLDVVLYDKETNNSDVIVVNYLQLPDIIKSELIFDVIINIVPAYDICKNISEYCIKMLKKSNNIRMIPLLVDLFDISFISNERLYMDYLINRNSILFKHTLLMRELHENMTVANK